MICVHRRHPRTSLAFLAAGIGEAFRHGQELSDHTEHEHNFLLDGLSGTNDSAGQTKVNEDIATALSSDAAQESSAIQQQLELNPDQMQQLATRHPDIFEQGPIPAQAFINVAQATAMHGQDPDEATRTAGHLGAHYRRQRARRWLA
jgi:hypothetical protein